MTLRPLPLLLVAFGLHTLSLHAGEITPFQSTTDLQDKFAIKQGKGGLALEEAGGEKVLRFEVKGSESALLVWGANRTAEKINVESASVDFLISKVGSVGLYICGDDSRPDKGAYLALINVLGKGRDRLRLFKNSIWPQQSPENDLLTNQNLKGIALQNWYRLEFSSEERDAATIVLKVKLSDIQTGAVLSEIELDDVIDPLPTTGHVALRLFSDKNAGGHVELKNFVIKER